MLIGIGEFGRTCARTFSSQISGHHPALPLGARAVCLDWFPPPVVDVPEADLERAALPAHRWFPDEEAFRACFGADDAALPDVSDPKWEEPLTRTRDELQSHVDALLAVGTGADLTAAGFERANLGGTVPVQFFLLLDAADDLAWAMATLVLDLLPKLILPPTDVGYWHVLVGRTRETPKARERLAWVADRLAAAGETFPFARAYPVFHRRSDGTLLTPQDVAALCGAFAWLNTLPSPPEPPLADLMWPAAPPADETAWPVAGFGVAADYLPIAELRRRMAFRLGYHLLGHSVCAENVHDAGSTLADIAAKPILHLLRENRLVDELLRDVPASPVWADEGEGTLVGLKIDQTSIRQRIATAPLDDWPELVDNYDYLVTNFRLDEWKATIDANAHRLHEQIAAPDTGFAATVDQFMFGHRQPLRAAEAFLDQAASSVSRNAHPFRAMEIRVAKSDVEARRKTLDKVVRTFPALPSLALRGVALLLLAAYTGLALAAHPIAGPLVAGFIALFGVFVGVLYWRSRLNHASNALEDCLAELRRKYDAILLQHLQSRFIAVDESIEALVKADREACAKLRAEVNTIRASYEGEMAKLTPDDNHLLRSVVRPEDLPELYADAHYDARYDEYAWNLIHTEFLKGWRAPDSGSLRRALWKFVGGIAQTFRPRAGLSRFMPEEAVPGRLADRAGQAQIAVQPAPGVPMRYVLFPPGPEWGASIAAAAGPLGLMELRGGSPHALAVMQLQDGLPRADDAD